MYVCMYDEADKGETQVCITLIAGILTLMLMSQGSAFQGLSFYG